jgi:hypothetical protein
VTGRAIAQEVSRCPPAVVARVRSQVRLLGFMVDKVALGQVFSEHFGFLCQFSFHRMVHTHLSSGAGTIGQLEPDVPSGLSLTPPDEIIKNRYNTTKLLVSYITHIASNQIAVLIFYVHGFKNRYKCITTDSLFS